ncbi:hypothetical protein [Sporomusa acidovorans]|uniref:Rubrerythrin n=1 Tax=Sporomusa acidovorans (strain ATCC 49682 / DSM 3132 / Mol) TaxID=1123286 RepID=A0ABZ3J0T5_SPOA4|nr:hypothetical protein [Sporomusa acidovorans]OZC21358.1 hypothetical protein SPACI_19850 [Sporomusa acidovorans DSM 3132]SDE56288.1 hypothetical protein SAMN04488499_101654 [Sporomusa acidovorans]
MHKKTEMESFASEYAMSAGDNALSREQINKSIISEAMTNEHKHREAFEKFFTDGAAD